MQDWGAAPPCPLCLTNESEGYHRDQAREYWHCTHCSLVFVPRRHHLSHAAEKAQYDNHRNQIDDPGYRSFLGRLATPLQLVLTPGSRGLDFGCGPGPALAAMLSESGFEMTCYDIYYCPDNSALTAHYDFITATEVIEHLGKPNVQLPMLWSLLRPGGTLGLMTKLRGEREHFARWHYIRDPTHIAFYSRSCFRWLAAYLQAEVSFFGDDVIILKKPL